MVGSTPEYARPAKVPMIFYANFAKNKRPLSD